MSRYLIECVFAEPTILGESPLWHVEEQALYWVDIEKPALHCLNPKLNQHRMWPMPTSIACIGMRKKGGLVAAMRYGFAHISLPSGEVTMINSPILDTDGAMFNDGSCDRAGNFWVGTKDLLPEGSIRSIYRLNQKETCIKIAPGFAVTNGIVWSPDNSQAYICDSVERIIYQYDFAMEISTLSNERVFAQLSKEDGYPDGLTVDSEGGVWNAHWDGWRITRYLPNGKIDDVIKLPVRCPTSCCFGGPDLKTLFVTSASMGMNEDELKQNPQAGCVFAIQVGIQGLPEPSFLG